MYIQTVVQQLVGFVATKAPRFLYFNSVRERVTIFINEVAGKRAFSRVRSKVA